MNEPELPTSGPTTSAQPTRPRVAIVFGGRSGEHAISCLTAGNVLRVIDREAYDVVPIGITRTGRWVLAADNPERWSLTAGRLPEVTPGEGPGVLVPLEVGQSDLVVLEPGQVPATLSAVDVVLPLLHGPFGEDGTLQGLLELADVRYVGSGVLASAVSMDKHYMKLLLAGAGIPVGDHLLVTGRDWEQRPDDVREQVEAIGWPVFVKPARGGSSIGVTKVKGPADLEAAIEVARQYDPRVIVEAGIEGREIECGVLGALDGGRPDTSVPGECEVLAGHEFYDFAAKYLEGEKGLKMTCPADLPDDVAERVRELSARTFEALGCEGLARVDFFLKPDGTLLVNEINSMPGFTPTSMFPLLWEASGMGYPELVDRLIQLALNRPTGLR